MQADFPNSIHTWDDVEDDVDIISGAHMNSAHAECIAIETLLSEQQSNVQAYRHTSNQSIASSTLTTLQIQGELADYLGEYDASSTFYFQPDSPGWFYVHCTVTLANGEVGKYAVLQAFVDSVSNLRSLFWPTQVDQFVISIQGDIYITDTQNLKFTVFHNHSSALAMLYGRDQSYFTIKRRINW